MGRKQIGDKHETNANLSAHPTATTGAGLTALPSAFSLTGTTSSAAGTTNCTGTLAAAGATSGILRAPEFTALCGSHAMHNGCWQKA
ncbi:MAG: hypothetical protein ACRYFS_16195 [Janthinobacterium lividum]